MVKQEVASAVEYLFWFQKNNPLKKKAVDSCNSYCSLISGLAVLAPHVKVSLSKMLNAKR